MLFHTIRLEVTFALRRLSRSPFFALGVVLSLTLGIAAEVTILAMLDALVLRPPAHVRDVERLVNVRLSTYPDYNDLKDQARSLAGVAAWFAPPRPYSLLEGERLVPAQEMLASASLFSVLGTQAMLGRFFTDAEDRPGGPHVAVLGNSFWTREFGGADDVLGKTIHVAGDIYTIIGVAPRGFDGVALTQIDLFLPITTTKFDAGSAALASRNYSWLHVVARLAPGVDIGRARAEAKIVFLRGNPGDTVRGQPTSPTGTTQADVMPLRQYRRELATANMPIALWLTAVATAVLLIACSNVAALILVRAIGARHSNVVRLALGASHGRIAIAMIFDSAVLAITGGGLALILSWSANVLICRRVFTDLAPVPSPFDARFVGMTVLVTSATSLVCLVWPTLGAARGSVATDVLNSGRTVAAKFGRSRRAMLIAQLSLTMVLLVGADLFAMSLHNARATDLGMSLDSVLISDLDLAGAGYTVSRARARVEPLIAQLLAIPGVRSAALSDAGMKPGWMTLDYSVPGVDSTTRGSTFTTTHGFSAVTAGFFTTLGMKIIQGRDFRPGDHDARVVIVSDGFARLYWGGQYPLGKCVRIGDASAPCSEVIGIARDRRGAPGDSAKLIEAFVPLGSPAEPPKIAALFPLTSVALRIDGDVRRAAPSAQRVLQEEFPGAPFIRVRAARSMFERAERVWRLGTTVFSALGVLAIVLSLLGVYGATEYLVAQRRRELAIRAALGATPSDISKLVLREAVWVALAGVSVGTVAAVLLARGIHALLFGVSPVALGAYVLASTALFLTSIAAAVIPMRRAAAIEPTATLRLD
jgi:predicted permease